MTGEVIISDCEAYPTERWSPQDGQRALDAWKASGLTRVAWCKQTGVAHHRLSYWSAKLSPPLGADVPVDGFVQLARADEDGCPSKHAEGPLMATLPNGVRLHLSSVNAFDVFIRAVRALA